ncbi:BamA/TamA family outer membrane protein [Odoribacter lunatus]|uniref:translocation and assembly module lipoprotein TamL n=1 Tax=Odoribacter lunatus TaxID=2941335 RepID=UPI00203F39DD|nr:BamA/TamA family outer membrane protein [Odoribacter lunatus]
MEKRGLYKVLLFVLGVVALYSCSPVKYVPENDYLLDKVTVETDMKELNKADIKKNIRQRPNTRILGVARFHLGLYNLSGRNGEKKFNKWLRNIGEAPVIYNDFLTERSKVQIEQYLHNKGYYEAKVRDTVTFKKKKAAVSYFVTPGRPMTVAEFDYKDKYKYNEQGLRDTAAVMKEVLAGMEKTLIEKGKPLDVDVLEMERERITRMLREKGYFNFSKNYIQFYADTSFGVSEQARVSMNLVGTPVDTNAYKKYKIGRINIHLDYDPLVFMKGRDSSYLDTTIGTYGITYKERLKIKPRLIAETIQFTAGEEYNVRKVMDSYARLQALNLFKFINIVFREGPDDEDGKTLLCDVQLTPMKRQSYNIFLEGTHNSGNIGVGGNLTYNHLNLFRSGENLSLSFWGALKKERFNEGKIFSTKEVGVELGLVSPQFWLPFLRLEDFRRNFAPKTSLSFSFSYEHTPFYDRKIAGAKFGYLWRETYGRWRYNFDLADFNYVLMERVDAGFIDSLRNEYVKSAYKSHLILSAGFTGVYTDQVLNSPGSYNYFRSSIETSGNFLWVLDKAFGGRKIQNDGERYYETLGVRYAQYVKADGEYRFNHYINRANTMVYRVFLGCGYPYGNMKVLPFEEAFYGGGANGIRAWQARTLGPGSYVAENNYPNSVGDFKLEANMEYRFKLFWLLEGAFFLDMGNIWNINKYEDRKGTVLGSDFYKQIAMGTGAGLRLDANFFLLRFDWGIKMRDPSKPEHQRFVLVNNGKWMKHTVFNIAIGYPF